MEETVTSIDYEQRRHPNIKHALDVCSRVARGDYHIFFKLYKNAPAMSGYLMDHFLERERINAIKVMCKAYRPNLPLKFIAQELCFENEQGYVSERKLKRWLKEYGIVIKKGELVLDTKNVVGIFIEKVDDLMKKVDIKGQIH